MLRGHTWQNCFQCRLISPTHLFLLENSILKSSVKVLIDGVVLSCDFYVEQYPVLLLSVESWWAENEKSSIWFQYYVDFKTQVCKKMPDWRRLEETLRQKCFVKILFTFQTDSVYAQSISFASHYATALLVIFQTLAHDDHSFSSKGCYLLRSKQKINRKIVVSDFWKYIGSIDALSSKTEGNFLDCCKILSSETDIWSMLS